MKIKPSSIPCVICNRTPSDQCHIKSKGSGGTMDEWNLIPMCRLHHNNSHDLGWSRFILKYPHLLVILKAKGWSLEKILGQVKLVRE